MEDYNTEDNGLTNKAIVLLERVIVELERLRIDKITDVSLRRSFEGLTSGLENIKLLINKNPRFDWVIIQEEIDRLFNNDRNLTGVIMKLHWKEGGNWAEINGQLGKAS